jgi:hypothetical protein
MSHSASSNPPVMQSSGVTGGLASRCCYFQNRKHYVGFRF